MRIKNFKESHRDLSYRERKNRENKIRSFAFKLILFLAAIWLFPPLIDIFISLLPVLNKTSTLFLDWLLKLDLDQLSFLGKSYWEWTELLVIPIVLGSGGLVLRQAVARQEKERAYDEALNTYLSRIADLMLNPAWPLKKHAILNDIELQNSNETLRLEALVQALTVTTFKNLPPSRQQLLLRFLIESDAIQFIDLRTLNLRRANLSNANLAGKCLDGACLVGANLMNVDATGASFRGADMLWCKLDNANLSEANLTDAELIAAEFINTNLTKANLSRAKLEGAVLIDTTLSGANLSKANLYCTHIKNVDFNGTILRGITWDKDGFPSKEELQLDNAIDVPEYIRQRLESDW